MRYLFNGMVFDSERFELTSGSALLPLRAQALALLQYLLENRHRLVGKDELVEHVWGGRAVTDSAITVTVRSLRKAIGREMVRTVYGQGVTFSAAVTLLQPGIAADSATAIDDGLRDDGATGGRPAVAVLPFRVTGGETPHSFLAEALPDDILTSLSKLRWLFVIARGSSFQFPSFALTPAEIGARLNARYCLSGGMEFAAGTIRVTVELADTATGEALWREDFNVRPQGVHDIRQEVVRKVAAEANARISSRELERARMKAPDSLDAWEHFHLGLFGVQTADMRRHEEARRHFQRALALDPGFARAQAGLANADFLRTFLREEGAQEAAVRALTVARTAVEADPLDPYCNLMAARMELLVGDIAEGLAGLHSTIDLAPSYSVAHADLARIQVMTGEPQAARRSLEMALALNPADPYNHTSFLTLALIEMCDGRFAEAAQAAAKTRKLPCRTLSEQVASMLAFHLAGQGAAAAEEAREIEKQHGRLDHASFLASLPFLAMELQVLVRDVFPLYGLTG